VQTEVVKNAMGNEDIDLNVCCMCFQWWHDEGGGAEWVSRKCGRWMHKDCIEDVVINRQCWILAFLIFFVLTNTLCEQLLYNNCTLLNMKMTHTNNFKLCMSVSQWKMNFIRNGQNIYM